MNRMQLVEECYADKDDVSVFNCLLLCSSSSSSFAHYRVPMLLFSKPTTNKTTLNLHARVSDTADRVISQIHNSLRAYPILNNLLSLPSTFHNFSKIHKENSRNVSFVFNHNFAAILPGDSVAGVVVANGILNFLNIYNTLLICRLVLTWFPNSPPAIVSPLSTLCDPYLNIFRGIIPPLGGTLDLSPILAFLVLNAFTSTAAALPAELPPIVKSQNHPISPSNLTSSQQKWTRRVFQGKTKNSSDDN